MGSVVFDVRFYYRLFWTTIYVFSDDEDIWGLSEDSEGDLQGGQPVFTLLDAVRENVSSVPIRLVGGKTVREGRLQVC